MEQIYPTVKHVMAKMTVKFCCVHISWAKTEQPNDITIAKMWSNQKSSHTLHWKCKLGNHFKRKTWQNLVLITLPKHMTTGFTHRNIA